jgi:hypothetical protein
LSIEVTIHSTRDAPITLRAENSQLAAFGPPREPCGSPDHNLSHRLQLAQVAEKTNTILERDAIGQTRIGRSSHHLSREPIQ